MENYRQIFTILAHSWRLGNGLISIRQNNNLSSEVISAAKVVVQKPFFRTWSSVIPEEALKVERTFLVFRSTILLAGPQSTHRRQFWDGSGNFLSNVPPGKSHRFCGYTNLSFTVLLSDHVFGFLRPFLEDPELEQFN
jgi:hypothetical protein